MNAQQRGRISNANQLPSTEESWGFLLGMIKWGDQQAQITIEDGGRIVPLSEEMKTRILMSTDSLNAGDERYATLELNEAKLKEYLKKLGDALGPEAVPSEPKEPSEEFCAPKDIGSAGLETPLMSYAQYSKQVEEETVAQLEQIYDLCEMINGIEFGDWGDWELFEDFEGFPVAEYWRKLLEKIAYLSKLFQLFMSDALRMSAEAAAAPKPPLPQQNNTVLYEILQGEFSNTWAEPYVVASRLPDFPDAVVPVWRIGSPNEESPGYVEFSFNNEEVFISAVMPDADGNLISPVFLGSARLASDNAIGMEGNNFVIKGKARPDGKPAGTTFDVFTTAMANAINNAIEVSAPTTVRDRNVDGYAFPLGFGLNFHKIKDLGSYFFANGDGIATLRPYTAALSEPLFITNGNPCPDIRKEMIAKSCMASLQARITTFMLNLGPILRAYHGFNMPDTVSMMAGYLAQKFEYETSRTGLYEIYLTSMDAVDDVYSGGVANDAGVTFQIGDRHDLRSKLDRAIELILKTMMYRVGTKTRYYSANTNIFKEREYREHFTAFADFVRRGTHNAGPNRQLTAQSLGGDAESPSAFSGETAGVAPKIKALHNTRYAGSSSEIWNSQDSLYYLPQPLIMGLLAIYYDHVVNIQNRLPMFKFMTGKRIAAADDTFMTAVNPDNITAFSDSYSSFPLVLSGKTYYSEREVRDEIKRLQGFWDRINDYQTMLGISVYGQGGYSGFIVALEEGVLKPSNMDPLEANASTNRDFWNTLYAFRPQGNQSILQRFQALPQSTRVTWQRHALIANYGDANSIRAWPRDESVVENASTGLYAKNVVFTERLRLMEHAGAQSFIDQYKISADVKENYNPYAPVNGRTATGKTFLQNYISNQRTTLYNQSKVEFPVDWGPDYDPIPRWYKPKGADGQGYNGMSYPHPGMWGISGGELAFQDNYNGGPPPYGSNGFRGIDYTQDLITFGLIGHERGLVSADNLAGHFDTLDKVAISYIYYLLNYYSVNYYSSSNPDDPQSDINKLREFLNEQG